MKKEIDRKLQSRRRFLKLGVMAAAALAPRPALAGMRVLLERERALAFYNTHTGESLSTVYWAAGNYVAEGLKEIDFILRDFRAGEVKPIEPRLLDLLHVMARRLDARAPFHIISGYRTPATNAMLAERGHGVARLSLHIEGKAVDIRVPGRELSTVRRVALALGGGGVGYYPASDFVHVDTGRVRFW